MGEGGCGSSTHDSYKGPRTPLSIKAMSCYGSTSEQQGYSGNTMQHITSSHHATQSIIGLCDLKLNLTCLINLLIKKVRRTRPTKMLAGIKDIVR